MSAKRHPRNERVKRRYLQFLREAKGRDEASIDAVAKALERFDSFNRYRDLRKFHIEQAQAFKANLAEQRNVRNGKPLAASTIHSTLRALKAFFIWIADQSEYRSRIRYCDAEYFNSPDNLARVATAHRLKRYPSLEEIHKAVAAMPAVTDTERRDRALFAFAILTGARDRAIISFKLKHIDLKNRLVMQDAREVRTKRAKSFPTWFFPVGLDILQIVVDWLAFLREERGFGPEDPLFPKSRVAQGPDLKFAPAGLDRAHWANAHPVRAIFRGAFELVGLPYYNPHAFRDTLVQLAYSLRLDAEEMKAWSQNLGHAHILTTFSSYGSIPDCRQGEIILGFAARDPEDSDDVAELLRKAAAKLESSKKAS
jgi:integrase